MAAVLGMPADLRVKFRWFSSVSARSRGDVSPLRPARSSWSRRRQPVQGEDCVAGGHDRPVDRMAWVVAGFERLEHRRCPVCHVLGCGQAGPPRDVLTPRGGICVPGSIGWPAASASRCVQVRGTTWTRSYPPPPVSSQRPSARSWVSAWIAAWAARCASMLSSRLASGSSRCVSQPCWLTSTCGRNAAAAAGRSRGRRAASCHRRSRRAARH